MTTSSHPPDTEKKEKCKCHYQCGCNKGECNCYSLVKTKESPKDTKFIPVTQWYKQIKDKVYWCHSFDGGETYYKRLTDYKEIPVVVVNFKSL